MVPIGSQDGHVASVAVVIALGVKGETGEWEVLGLDVGPSEDEAFGPPSCVRW